MDSKLRTCFLTLSVILTSVYFIYIAIAIGNSPAPPFTPDHQESAVGTVKDDEDDDVNCDVYVASRLSNWQLDTVKVESYHWADTWGEAVGRRFRREYQDARGLLGSGENIVALEAGGVLCDEEYFGSTENWNLQTKRRREFYTSCRDFDEGGEVKVSVFESW